MFGRLQQYLSKPFKGVRDDSRSVTDDIRCVRDDESGVILLITVVVVAALAAAVAGALLLDVIGPRPEIKNIQGNSAKLKKINSAIVLHAISDSNYLLPCPASGTASDGVAIACTDTSNNVGTVPWSTLGLSEEDATDVYGNQIVYAVSVTGTGPREACVTSGGSATGAVTTGTVATQSGTTTPVAGSPVLYALISQGRNLRGALTQSGTARTAPTSTNENQNCASGSTCSGGTANTIHTGPQNDDGNGAEHFDDEIFLSSNSDFTNECSNFASSVDDPLAFVDESFGGSSGDGDSSDITVTPNTGAGASSVEGSGVITVTQDVEIETVSTLFRPDATPLYIKIDWTPTAVGTGDTVRMSIVTRADASVAATLSNDIFDTDSTGAGQVDGGYTVRFAGTDDGTAGGGAITVDIMENLTSAATSLSPTVVGTAMVDISAGDSFELEVFDDGTQIWARITEIGDTSNQQTAYATSLTDSLGFDNQVVFAHNPATGAVSTLDNLIVALGTIAVELDDAGQLSNSTAPLTSMTATETSFTQEGWLYIRDTAAATVSLFSVTESPVGENSLFRADIANSELEYSDSTPASLVAGSQTYNTGRWRHYAFNCASGSDRSLYLNGSLTGAADTTACDILPNTTALAATETVSMVNNTGGRVVLSEMRLWSTAQGGTSVGTNYNVRNPSTITNLHHQLHLQDAFGTTTATDAETTNGTQNYGVSDGRFVGFRSPFGSAAADVCPLLNVDSSDPYKCVFSGTAGTETSFTLDIPLDVTEVLIKVWGAGGGGGVGANGRTGGGAGYASGRLTSVGGSNIAGRQIILSAAGAGQIGGADTSGGGGGGSAVEFSDGSTTTLVAVAGGGGGGAARGNSATAGLGGGGTTTEPVTVITCSVATVAAGEPSPVGGTPGAGANCNGTAGAGVTAGGANGGNGDTATGGVGGTGYGNGGRGGAGGNNQGGGGGGGGYTSGAGGGSQGQNAGGGGGASGYVLPTDLTSAVITATTGATAANNGDADRGGAGSGGAIGAAGSPGRVVICWSAACLP